MIKKGNSINKIKNIPKRTIVAFLIVAMANVVCILVASF